MATDFWLSVWASSSSQQSIFIIGIYGMLCALTMTLSLSKALLFFFSTLKASSYLHSSALKSVLSAPMFFFTMTPIGRILNRFSADLSQVNCR